MSFVRAAHLARATRSSVAFTASRHGTWGAVPLGPPDAILGITEAYKRCEHPDKMNLGVGAYRDDHGNPYVLNAVRKAEAVVVDENLNKEYAPITGVNDFRRLAAELAYAPSAAPLQDKRVATAQALSGTGALRVAAVLLNRFICTTPDTQTIWMPNPTWGNHIPIFKDAGFQVEKYRYYDSSTCGLDINGLLEDLSTKPAPGSAVILHACAHNPTGVDPTQEQWKEIAHVCKERQLQPLFDMAYQGFASGDSDRDAWALRYFVDQGFQPVLTQSFSKNMGLYGERVGLLSVVTDSPEEAAAVESQIKIIIRPMYSNPPIHGARVAAKVMSDPALNDEWLVELKGMADRINTMRSQLKSLLEEEGSVHDWSHITNQIGMFCYTGLTPQQVEAITAEHHVYLTKDGRISMAGVSSDNVAHLAYSMHSVTK
eukprot:TRINITY_DN1912_c0_g1_i1.p1 TRINITY_DN1912_c0_g1~~TRINITY_DN1912_c0_g1_i1.p1  ORF type:complete len:429 (+),score=86.66 TRINITY_DN1912_c0_g1_i1:79-1365(+)